MTDNAKENKEDAEGLCLKCSLEELLTKHKTLMGEIIYRKSLLPDERFDVLSPDAKHAVDELSLVLDLVVYFHDDLEALRIDVINAMTQVCNKSENSFEKPD